MKYVPITIEKIVKHILNNEENNQRIARIEECTIYTENKHYEEIETILLNSTMTTHMKSGT